MGYLFFFFSGGAVESLICPFIEIDDEDNDFIDSGDVFSIDVDFDDGTLSAEME